MPTQVVRVSGAFRGDPLHPLSPCARDEPTLRALCHRQRCAGHLSNQIRGRTIDRYSIGDDWIDLELTGGAVLTIRAADGRAAASVRHRGDCNPEPGSPGRLQPSCTLLFLPERPKERAPKKKPKRMRQGKPRQHKPDEASKLPDFQTVWRRHDLPRALIGRSVLAIRSEPMSMRLLIAETPGSIRFSPLRERGRPWFLWWCHDDVCASPGLAGAANSLSPLARQVEERRRR